MTSRILQLLARELRFTDPVGRSAITTTQEALSARQ
jgi:hypothetical protein